MTASNAILTSCTVWSKDGTQTLSLQKRGIPLPGVPDPWLGKSITWSYGPTGSETLYFAGDVVSMAPAFDEKLGWVLHYECLGLRWRGDLVPVTDDNTGIDPIRFNLEVDDPDYIASRAGRNVGQVVSDVLGMTTNSARLSALGITSGSSTASDLAALTTVPPYPVTIAGEKILTALAGFLSSAAPNHTLWVQPDGQIRVFDLRSFTPQTLTLGVDPIFPTELKRDTAVNFPRVQVRGQPKVVPMLLSTQNGGLAEDFAHDGLTNSAAKTAWKLSDFLQTQSAADTGTCTCPSTTTVRVTSSNGSAAWSSNFWDQTSSGAHGTIYLAYSAGSGVTQYFSAKIVSNTALTAGGTSTLTLDRALPITSYDSYSIYGQQSGASKVWRLYSVVNSTIAAKMQSHFPYPVPYRNSDGTSSTLTTWPTSDIVWNPTGGGAPYFEAPMGFTQDPVAGTILFNRPVVTLTETDQNKLNTAGAYNTPHDVRVLLAIAVDSLLSTSPADVGGVAQYSGTSNSVEGLQRTLYVTVPTWRDSSNQSNMDAFAADLHDSVKDTIVEGELTYLGLFSAALTPGVAINIAGNNGASYTTGWESVNLPIVETTLTWEQGTGTPFRTHCKLSNRRAQYTAGNFLRPNIAGQALGGTLGGPGGIVGAIVSQVEHALGIDPATGYPAAAGGDFWEQSL